MPRLNGAVRLRLFIGDRENRPQNNLLAAISAADILCDLLGRRRALKTNGANKHGRNSHEQNQTADENKF